MQISLDEQVWGQVLACLAKSPWEIANPLIMAIGEQMRQQKEAQASAQAQVRRGNGLDEQEARN